MAPLEPSAMGAINPQSAMDEHKQPPQDPSTAAPGKRRAPRPRPPQTCPGAPATALANIKVRNQTGRDAAVTAATAVHDVTQGARFQVVSVTVPAAALRDLACHPDVVRVDQVWQRRLDRQPSMPSSPPSVVLFHDL